MRRSSPSIVRAGATPTCRARSSPASRSTSSSRSSTDPTARTGRCRVCSNWPAFPTSARACSRRPSQWTRLSPRGSSPRAASRSAPTASARHTSGTRDRTRRLKYRMLVMPANLGSSVGISKAKDRASLRDAMTLAGSFDRKIVIEAAVPDAREIECAVLGNDEPEASVLGEIIPSREFYDYESKYLDEGSKWVIPADLPRPIAEHVRQLSIAAFKAIDGAGMARVDFLLARGNGALYLNEVNTIPGFTTISMYAKLWAASGVDYPALLDRLIGLAIERHAQKQQIRTSLT